MIFVPFAIILFICLVVTMLVVLNKKRCFFQRGKCVRTTTVIIVFVILKAAVCVSINQTVCERSSNDYWFVFWQEQ